MVGDISYILTEDEEFGIQELEDGRGSDKFFYQGDSIKYALDNALVDLYDLFRDHLFADTDLYYAEMSYLPMWVQDAGQNSDIAISSEMFSQWVEESSLPSLFRHLYLVDCQFLVGTIQNLLCAMESAFINYYKSIASVALLGGYKELTNPNGTIMIMGEQATQVANAVETYFTKAYSILDITCKICYELQYLRTEHDSYKKLKSADKLWGDRKKLRINECPGTIFEKCDFISVIEAIRNEIVHNGTWELNPKVFVRFKNGEEAERFMLFPDIEQGHLTTVKNRKHFFSSGVKVNDILPFRHMEFKQRLLATISEIFLIYKAE